MAPALDAIQQDLHFKSPLLGILSLSIFIMGTAVVPLFTAPLSEVFGRTLVLQSSNIWYIIFNTLCGVAKTQNQLIVFRFLAGLGGAGPFAVSLHCITLVNTVTNILVANTWATAWKWYRYRSVPTS